MPNWVYTSLTLEGSKDQINSFIKDNGDEQLSFDKLLPTPEELLNHDYPVRIMSQEQIDDMWEKFGKSKYTIHQTYPFGLGITRKQQIHLIKTYGVDNWYDWSINNWGTKWDASDIGNWVIEPTGRSASIRYSTAWSPATKFFLSVSINYPDIIFTHKFVDEGFGFVGYESIQNGKVITGEKYTENLKENTNAVNIMNELDYNEDSEDD
jgi:Ferredoxin-like domain in Api92-like protein